MAKKSKEAPPTNVSKETTPITKIISAKLKINLNLRLLVILAITIVAIGASVYFYQQYRVSQTELARLKADPREAARQEAGELVKKIGKLIDLPQGEDPTIATVTDAEKLKNQPFFAKAKNGDKVLIYTQAKRAFLYDPSSNKILEVAPINIGEQATQKK